MSLLTRVVLPKTTAYQIVAGDSAAFFTNRGATGSVTFTLPVSSTIQAGWWCEFYVVAAQAIVIASSPADLLAVHADAAADTISLAATIGQHARVVFDGFVFLVVPDVTAASGATAAFQAVTIAT